MSTFDRVAATPMRDLLRGHLSGRLNPDILCRDAALPEVVRSTICATTRRTRLLRGERSEVAAELIAHFGDGLGAGRTPHDLVESFGDIRTAARLIRRAKKRDRSLTLKFLFGSFKAFGVLVLAIVLTYAVLAARYSLVKPGPLVDYASRLNAAALATRAEDRAWPLYREQLLRPGFRAGSRTTVGDARPGWRIWPKTARFLEDHADAIASIRIGAGKPSLGFVPLGPLSPEDAALWPDLPDDIATGTGGLGLAEALLPVLGELNTLRRVLVADTRLAADEGDSGRAAEDLHALLGVANHLRETPFLINDLIALGCASSAVQESLWILHVRRDLLSSADLQRFAHALAAFPDDGEPIVRLRGERMIFEDAVQRMYSLDSDGDGVLAPGSFTRLLEAEGRGVSTPGFAERAAGPVFSAVSAGRKELLAFYTDGLDRAEAWSREPAWLRGEFDDPSDALESGYMRSRYLLASLVIPSFSSALLQGERFEQLRDAALAAIAVELFRRTHGSSPASLDVLTPDLLPRVPIDMFEGTPIKYRHDGDSFILYSIGNDYTDNGGTIPDWADPAGFAHMAGRWFARETAKERLAESNAGGPFKRYEHEPPPVRGDWVFFPPPLPNEPPPEDDIYFEFDAGAG